MLYSYWASPGFTRLIVRLKTVFVCNSKWRNKQCAVFVNKLQKHSKLTIYHLKQGYPFELTGVISLEPYLSNDGSDIVP